MEEHFGSKADSIHSGSISFGRFETEPLSWEKRSSFSHNRYLEEVEKYSTPGSVTQKKAYFEAHFKKKALLRQASADCQNGMEYHTSENDILDHMNNMEEFEHANVGSHSVHYDESPHGSDCQGKSYELGCERECDEISSYEFHKDTAPTFTNDDPGFDGNLQDYAPALTDDYALLDGYNQINAYPLSSDDEVLDGDVQDDALPLANDDAVLNGDHQDDAPTLTNDDAVLDGDLQDVEPCEIHQTPFACNMLPLVKHEPEIEVIDKLADETENVKILQRPSSAPVSHMAVNDDNPSMKKSHKQTLKVKATTETKTAKPKLRAQVPRKTSSEVPKYSTKNPRRERGSLLKTKKENPSLLKALPTGSSLARTSKSEDPENFTNFKAKLTQDSKSEKDLKAKKADSKSQPSTLERSEPKASQSVNRPKKTVNLTKSDIRASPAVFHLKSDERAEKRKEFYMKLEEKMHAKEAEMNQIQAKTQEEMEAEIKQLRKSLKFKATPMPSFYHEGAPRGSDGKKVVSSNVKCTSRSQSKSPNPRCTAAGRSQLTLKVGSQQGLSASDRGNTAALQQASEATDCTPTVPSEVGESTHSASTDKNANSKTVKRSDLVGKKDIEKGKDSKQHGSESSKLKKEKVEGSQVVEAVGRSSGEMVRKAMKRASGIGVGGGSGMGNLAVGVAS
ncbi:hypothetical protein NE237_021522 [Protea cynaroides]|uniref:TPX2 C-terminal domain-containing protein n=1 Tax=Protea cynaroides TaxID=273540 RepID=A0A9Q0H840_9MAGN|nr:hypothetical protein NE237_021522 [Protea cynaroides]